MKKLFAMLMATAFVLTAAVAVSAEISFSADEPTDLGEFLLEVGPGEEEIHLYSQSCSKSGLWHMVRGQIYQKRSRQRKTIRKIIPELNYSIRLKTMPPLSNYSFSIQDIGNL